MTNGLTLSFRSRLAEHHHVLWTGSTSALPLIGEFSEVHVMALPVASFKQHLAPLKLGRFYPAMILNTEEDLPGELFRVVKLDGSDFIADFNHPLASHAVTFGSEAISDTACGSTSPSELIRWAGIEVPLPEGDVDFHDPDAFKRDDATVDTEFFASPRKVMHVDSVCAERITAFYREHLASTDAVFDLMAAWRSHLPAHAGPVTGLGMNAEEMADNPQLQSCVCHDLNTSPRLPFEDATFEAVINTVSIEYLTQPLAVLQDVQRILKPGGKLLITFSNRFFPPKATALWKRLHPVERLGWVVQCLHAASFADIRTRVERGLKRDPSDRYAQQFKEMDPLFAVSAFKPAA